MRIPKDLIQMYETADELQKAWKPMVGDYILQRYTVFGEELDKKLWPKNKRNEVQILVYRSSIRNTYMATNQAGETRIFNSIKDLKKRTCIWIPRLDQLQKMIKIEQKYPGSFLYQHTDAIDEMICYAYKDVHTYLQTYETIWLAYVMYKLYNKKWNGKNWEILKGLK